MRKMVWGALGLMASGLAGYGLLRSGGNDAGSVPEAWVKITQTVPRENEAEPTAPVLATPSAAATGTPLPTREARLQELRAKRARLEETTRSVAALAEASRTLEEAQKKASLWRSQVAKSKNRPESWESLDTKERDMLEAADRLESEAMSRFQAALVAARRVRSSNLAGGK